MAAQPSATAPHAPPRPTGRRRKPSWRAKLLLVAFACGLCLLTLEVILRATWSGQWTLPKEFMLPESVFTYQFKPNIDLTIPIADSGTFPVRTNARGFRGPTVADLASKDLRIVAIGDSFAFGWGIRQEDLGLVRAVDAFANAHPDRSVGLAHVAMGGWGPDDYLYAYMTEVLPADIDVLVLGVFPGNDILPLNHSRSTTPTPHPPANSAPSLLTRLRPKVYDFAKSQISGSMLFNRLAIRMGTVPDSFKRFATDIDAQNAEWATTFFYLDQLFSRAKGRGVEVVVLCYPSSIQISAAATIDAAGLDHTMPERVLGAFCASRQVRFIEMAGDLTAAAASAPDLYFKIDRHLTAKGHDVVTRVLERELNPILDDVLKRKAAK